MKVNWLKIAAYGLVAMSLGLVAHGAQAADTNARPVSAKRQMVLCMTKRMSDSRTLSYNDASKLCKEQVEAQRVTSTTGVLAKPMAP